MDWSKAKTILIVAFIITNIFIIYVIIGDGSIDEPTISDEFIANVEELLADRNISIDTNIPKDIPGLNAMIVGFESADIKKLNENYFDNNGITENNEGSIKDIKRDDESFLIMNNRLIIYENRSEKETFSGLNKDKAIKISEEFMAKGNFDVSDMELTFIKEENGTFFLEYSKVYNDILIERAFTNLQIDSRGVKRFERLWLNSKELGEVEIYISTAPKSLLALLDMHEVYDKTIIDISLCYYFDPEKHEYLEEPGETRQGKAVPAWKIQFDDGYKVFIDEY